MILYYMANTLARCIHCFTTTDKESLEKHPQLLVVSLWRTLGSAHRLIHGW